MKTLYAIAGVIFLIALCLVIAVIALVNISLTWTLFTASPLLRVTFAVFTAFSGGLLIRIAVLDMIKVFKWSQR